MLSLPTKYRNNKEIFGSEGMFSTLVVVSQIYAYVKTDQNVLIKCIQFFM